MESISRREFVGAAVAGAVALTGHKATAQAPELRSPVQQVPLGRTGLTASLIGLGTGVHGWMRQSDHTRMGRDNFDRLLNHVLDRGITLIDAADLYGTHQLLRDVLKGRDRSKLTIQSKIWWSPGGLPERVTDAKVAVERFLLELGLDYLDSVLLHCTGSGNWPDELEPLRDGLEEAKQTGLIRAHGTSCHSRAALDASRASPWVDIQLARVNHRGAFMDGTPDEIVALLRQMKAAGKGVIGMKIFGEGRFRSPEEREASLRFVLGQRPVDAMIIGFEKPEEVDETLAMAERILAG